MFRASAAPVVIWSGNTLGPGVTAMTLAGTRAAFDATGSAGSITVTASALQQTGTTLIGANGGPVDLSITLAGPGTISFDPTAGQGLVGPATSLLLALGTGNATGTIDVAALAVSRTTATPAAQTLLLGSIAGTAGAPASGLATITPGPDDRLPAQRLRDRRRLRRHHTHAARTAHADPARAARAA